MATITEPTLQSGDLRLAAVLSQEIALLLADRTSMRNTGAIVNHGLINGQGSDTVKIRKAGLDGYDKFATAGADGSDVGTPEDLTSSATSLTVARYALRRDLTDLGELSGMGGADITPQRLALSMVGEAEKCFMSLVATAIASFGATDAGSTGVDLSVDDWFDAIRTLQVAGNSGPTFALLHPTQLSDLQNSIRAEAGSIQWVQATQDMLSVKPAGYAGMFAGVEIYTNTEVTATGTTDYNGGMWNAGAIGYVEAAPVGAFGDIVRPGASPLQVEFERDASAGLTSIVGSYYVGVGIVQDGMGVGIVTDY